MDGLYRRVNAKVNSKNVKLKLEFVSDVMSLFLMISGRISLSIGNNDSLQSLLLDTGKLAVTVVKYHCAVFAHKS